MTVKTAPEAALSTLPRADGSATYSYAGYTVTGSANGPIEAPRRDEHPYEAFVDVVVRPAAGVGGTRERHVESLVQSALSQIILVKNFPRQLIQVVLQIQETPENDYVNTKLVQAQLNLPVIPALLQTAVLAVLSAAIPMRATATACVAAILVQNGIKQIVADPSPRDLEQAQSTHVLAFTSKDELLLAESEGNFTMDEWNDVHALASKICCSAAAKKQGIDMIVDEDETQDVPDMRNFLRSTMEDKISNDLHWRR